MTSSRIGEALVQSGRLSSDQLTQAIEAQKRKGGWITTQFVQMGFLSEAELLQGVSDYYGLPMVELGSISIDHSILQLIPASLASKHGLIPLGRKDHTLTVCVTDPSNMAALNEIRFITGLDVQLCVGKISEIRYLQERLYENKPAYDQILHEARAEQPIDVVQTQDDVDLLALEQATADAPVVKLVNAILSDAICKNTSDIHFEPYENSCRVRFRIDGILYEIMRPPAKLKNALISRLKIMAHLDIAERRLPQDGRMKLRLENEKMVDFRVNVTPTLFGEKVVLRLLDTSNVQLDINKLGFDPTQLCHFKEAISEPHGMILVTGPTGSGKSTTLYAALSELNKMTTNICTVEDPVEINLPGINQSQVHDEIGFSFASALRAFLRQDPDIIMVGEIRDQETAEIAIKASMTGHLVLSTLHTNDAPSSVNRLLNMGVEPFLVSSSINLVVAQRLARRICVYCSTETSIPTEALTAAGIPPGQAETIKLRKPVGCQRCADTGYRGRIALYEIMRICDEIRDLILKGAPAPQIKQVAIRKGMTTLRQSGLARLAEGVTTLEEILRITKAE
jgi:type IV pilus assembly protein PilB